MRGSRETSQEVLAVTQGRGDGGLAQGASDGGGEMWLESEYILKVETVGFPAGIDVG